MKSRMFSLDLLRVIGLLCIILAHISPPNIIFQIRNFDVPFMVIISGILFNLTNVDKDDKVNLIEYIKKRFVRLVIPVWIFLSVLFLSVLFIDVIFKIKYPFTLNCILTSYFLWSGIGYLWIIRIYFIVAIFGPIVVNKLKKIENKLGIILLFYFIYEIVTFCFETYYKIKFKDILEELILSPLIYILIFVYGVYFYQLKKNKVILMAIISSIVLLGTQIYQYMYLRENINLQMYKYPPRLIYIYYVIVVSAILLLNISKYEKIRNNKIRKIISFIGASTMWIYLWHIPCVMFMQMYKVNLNFIIKYFIVLTVSILITAIQQKIVNIILIRSKISEKNKKIFRNILCS